MKKKRTLVKQRKKPAPRRTESSRAGPHPAPDVRPSAARRLVPQTKRVAVKEPEIAGRPDPADKPVQMPDGGMTTMRQLFPGLYPDGGVDSDSRLGQMATAQMAGITDVALIKQTPCGVCKFVATPTNPGLGRSTVPHEWWCVYWELTGATPF